MFNHLARMWARFQAEIIKFLGLPNKSEATQIGVIID